MGPATVNPEIVGDNLAELIAWHAERARGPMLEIGSGSGRGSTLAFVRGMARAARPQPLHCIEIDHGRAEDVRALYRGIDNVTVHWACSVSPADYPLWDEVQAWMDAHPSPLDAHGKAAVLTWLLSDLDYLRTSGVRINAIAGIKRGLALEHFDVVLIDGCEFTGGAELAQVIGARVIFLDDVATFKCHGARAQLLADPRYSLAGQDLARRHGWSCFVRVPHVALEET